MMTPRRTRTALVSTLLALFLAACSAAPHDDSESGANALDTTAEATTMDARTTATTFFERFDAGDVDGAFSLVDDDVSWWVPDGLPFSGTKNKAEYLAQVVKPINDGFPGGLQMKLRGTIVEGERVAAEVESLGQHKNGRTYNNHYHFLLVIRDGRIVAVKEYMDTLHLAQLLK
jgi:uncharacterized protein